ncbi:MAG: LytTR family DNA-binding domain-containing protein [Lachnospiraceae bacterium]|nr:LytTR family DNA-binding domain-containing protein [Lachnospiraceae bacterium]
MKLAVCDDDSTFIDFFIDKINEIIPLCSSSNTRADIYVNPKTLLESNEIYDILFLDIDMPSLDGISVAKKYANKITKIIFVTSKDALVYKAYNSTESFGFVRKNNLLSDLKEVMHRYEIVDQRDKYYTLSTSGGVTNIRYCDINYIEKIGNKVFIHTGNGVFSERKSISFFEKLLCPHGFVRTHVGYIINLDAVDSISKSEITLLNTEKIPVSRNKLKNVKSEFVMRSALSVE